MTKRATLQTGGNAANPSPRAVRSRWDWRKIWDVDPVAKTAAVWLNTLPSPQQMTFNEDGQMLFVTQATTPGDVLGIDVMTKATIFDYAQLNSSNPLNQPEGVAIGSGALERDLFVSCGDGTVWQIDRGDASATEVASGGTRGQAARCSINQSLLLSQTDRIMRLTAPAGSGFGYNSPYNFKVVATAGDRIALYWDGVPGAIGYNIYRAFNTGEEDYMAPPQNGSTPWVGLSYAGGNNYRYVEAGLFSGLEYFYTVKAVFPQGSSQPSREDSDIPDPSAIPWDSSDPGAVLTAIRQAYSDGQIAIADNFRSATPDGRIYEQTVAYGTTDISPADGTYLRYTGQYRFPDGTYLTLPNDPDSTGGVWTQSAGALAASDGPYRRVTIRENLGYCGCKGQFVLPDPTHYGVAANSKDELYLYLGSSAPGTEVDAGLVKQHSPTHLGWTPFIHGSVGDDRADETLVSPKAQSDFAGGQTVDITYLARPAAPFPPPAHSVPAVVTVSNQSRSQTVSWAAEVYHKKDGFRLKRIYAIAQGKPPVKYRPTGSWYSGAEFDAGYAIAYGGRNDLWDVGMTLDSQTGSYPANSGVVTWFEYGLYYQDTNIAINLR